MFEIFIYTAFAIPTFAFVVMYVATQIDRMVTLHDIRMTNMIHDAILAEFRAALERYYQEEDDGTVYAASG